jgi:hypothetical protein
MVELAIDPFAEHVIETVPNRTPLDERTPKQLSRDAGALLALRFRQMSLAKEKSWLD